MFGYATSSEVKAVRAAGPDTLCAGCCRPFSEHRRGQVWRSPSQGGFIWCDVPYLYVGDDQVPFPEYVK